MLRGLSRQEFLDAERFLLISDSYERRVTQNPNVSALRCVVEVEQLDPDGESLSISATPDERQILADRLGLASLDRLDADASLKRLEDSQSVELAVHLSADLSQSCVITLDPIAQHIDERFRLVYTPPVVQDAQADAVIVAIDQDDPPEPLIDGKIDIGAVVEEHLVLSIEPYPKKNGAILDDKYRSVAGDGDDRPDNPFAALSVLKEKS